MGVVRVPPGALAGATGAARKGAAGAAFASFIGVGRVPEGALADTGGTARTAGITAASMGIVRVPICGVFADPARAAPVAGFGVAGRSSPVAGFG
jgi:hypothetical protein